MTDGSFPGPFEERVAWIVRESLLVGGILATWVGIGIGITLVLSAVALVIQAFRLAPLRFLYEFAGRSHLLWPAVTQLAAATTGLYVIVRAGTVLIDRWRAPVDA